MSAATVSVQEFSALDVVSRPSISLETLEGLGVRREVRGAVLISREAIFSAVFRARNCVVYLTTIAAFSLIAVVAPRLNTWLLVSLESRFPKWEIVPNAAPDGIIVLGGESGERITASAELSRRFPQARLVYSGFGRLSDVEGCLHESGGLGADLGPIMETRSRSTYENAVYSKDLIKPKPQDNWLLITSAVHMPRAIGSFRRAGFNVQAYPVDFTQNSKDISDGQARGGEFAYREWIALVVYRLLGRTDAVFPAP